MILVDANLPIYAYDSSSKYHPPARSWFEGILSDSEPVKFSWTTLLAFLRITTHSRIFPQPFSIEEASAIIDEWLDLPQVGILQPGRRHWSILRRILPEAQIRGPLVPDAHLAALAIEYGATLCSHDRDFSRFDGLSWQDPLAA